MYTCIYNHRRECDGCGECDEREYVEYDNSDEELDRIRDKRLEAIEREEEC